jgi:hypothetical protein
LDEALVDDTVAVQEVELAEMVEIESEESPNGSTDESTISAATASPPTAELQDSKVSEASTAPESLFDTQSRTTSTSSATSLPPPPSPTASSIETTPDRPLSTLLSIFSHRATVCLSSLELLPDDSSALTDHPREPTAQEMREVERRMASEVQVVEAAIVRAVEERGIDESIKVEEGKTYFEDMEMVNALLLYEAEKTLLTHRRVSQSFVEVPVTEDGIRTEAFLVAMESLLKFFGKLLGS